MRVKACTAPSPPTEVGTSPFKGEEALPSAPTSRDGLYGNGRRASSFAKTSEGRRGADCHCGKAGT